MSIYGNFIGYDWSWNDLMEFDEIHWIFCGYSISKLRECGGVT